MGVTLERVQFKFASIIGELCSEPDVLSQFAVWVDLRLAEYKLKGSISLDCDGDTPDPIWLKGILSALLSKRLAQRNSSTPVQRPPSQTHARRVNAPVSRFSPSSRQSFVQSDRDIGTASPEILKRESDTDEVYPVSLHLIEREKVGNGSSRLDRKRSSTDYSLSPSASKERRLDISEDVQPSNESLMSIIGPDHTEEGHGAELDDSSMNVSATDYLIAQEITKNAQQDIEAARSGQWSTNDSLLATPSTSDFSPQIGCRGGTVHLTGPKIQQKKWRSAAAIFRRWFRQTFNKDNPPIEEFPCYELDKLLVEFFNTARKFTGEDYDVESYRKLRSNLSCYLRCKGYPWSISVDKEFKNSIEAFNKKKIELQNIKRGVFPPIKNEPSSTHMIKSVNIYNEPTDMIENVNINKGPTDMIENITINKGPTAMIENVNINKGPTDMIENGQIKQEIHSPDFQE